MDTSAQVWYFLLQYLGTTESRNLDLVECLGFLFQLSFSSLGQVMITITCISKNELFLTLFYFIFLRIKSGLQY